MILTKNDFENKVNIIYKGKGMGTLDNTVKLWEILYRYIGLSIYFGEDNSLGGEARTFFELYDGKNVMIFSETKEELSDAVKKLCEKHDQELKEYPERFI